MIYLCKVKHYRISDIPIRIGTHENNHTKFNIFYGKTIEKLVPSGRDGINGDCEVRIYRRGLLY